MKRYKPSLGAFFFSSFATMCLGIILIIPVVNNYLLNFVIEAETGINTKYYYRPFNKKPIWRGRE